mmetsp:Transcript_18957/g.44144  ORF Transcript_18957/g.44144 Transcript_18957/m.44144 type:complete len:279 (-) Transcript_18957:79-915(-)
MEDMAMDSLFSTFMNEVSNIRSHKMKNLEEKQGSPEEIVERLTSRTFDSAFQILQVSPEASDNDITKQYRKLSILIHPDKCKHEKAAEAFQVLAKAYADTKDPSYQDKYKDVVVEAKRRVRERREQQNKERERRGEDPLDTQGAEFDQEVLQECERMTTAVAEEEEAKNEVLAANLKRQKEMAKELKAKRREEELEKRKWERQRDKRVAGWQVFMNNVDSKKLKTTQSFGVGSADKHHKREGREMTEEELKEKMETETDKERRKRLQGAGREYKQAWR